MARGLRPPHTIRVGVGAAAAAGGATERKGRPPARAAQYLHAGKPGGPYGCGMLQPRSQRPAPGSSRGAFPGAKSRLPKRGPGRRRGTGQVLDSESAVVSASRSGRARRRGGPSNPNHTGNDIMQVSESESIPDGSS